MTGTAIEERIEETSARSHFFHSATMVFLSVHGNPRIHGPRAEMLLTIIDKLPIMRIRRTSDAK